MKCIYILFFGLTLSFASAAENLAFATHTQPPLSEFLEEVWSTALKPLGYGVSMVEMPGKRVIDMTNSGEVDADASRVHKFKELTAEISSNYVLVDEPIVMVQIVMVSQKGTDIPKPSWSVANQGKVAFVKGSKKIEKNVKKENQYPVNTNKFALRMVVDGRAESAILFASTANVLFRDNPELAEKLVIQQNPIKSWNFYTYLNTKHSQRVSELEKALKQLKQDGRYGKIAKKHLVSVPDGE